MTAPSSVVCKSLVGVKGGEKRSRDVVDIVTKLPDDKSSFKFSAVANTMSLDRDNEVVIPQGCKIEEFLLNPVMLATHNYRGNSVGRVDSIRVTDRVEFDFTIAETADGKELQYLYANNFQRAFSVGFMPLEGFWVESTMPDIIKIPINGQDVTINLSAYKRRPDLIITSWELVEISLCAVGSNPDARLIRQFAPGLDAAPEFIKSVTTEKIKSFIKSINQDVSTSFVVPFTKSSSVVDSSENIQLGITKYAMPDGEVDLKKVDFSKLSEGYSYIDIGSASSVSGYKLLHHTSDGKSLQLVKSALFSCMTELLTNQSQYGDSAKGIHDHLAGHYKECGIAAPELKSYTPEQLSIISKGASLGESSEDDGLTGNAQTVKIVGEAVKEATKATDVRLKKIESIITDVAIQLSLMAESNKVATPATPVTTPDSNAHDEFEAITDGLTKMIKAMTQVSTK
jgi:hypothetical protein